MKKIGLIGGIGPESSIEYYRSIIRHFQEQLGTKDYPEITIHSINMTEMLAYVFNNQLEQLVSFLLDKLKILELAGVDYAAIASNTPHIVFDKLAEKTAVPLISIVEETCKVVQQKNLKRVGLFGTKSTMTFGFYNRIAVKNGIEIIIPNSENRDYIHNKYMGELIFNDINLDTKQRLIEIAFELKEKESIQGLILGGTELPLILKQSDFNDIELFDSTQIHVNSIVKRMIEG
ncbi:MAG: amino acid racemase [Bacteroidales bacterium]|nr:amino acid racemase [Bacteroidales bacterium]